jgi:hypothetical protein
LIAQPGYHTTTAGRNGAAWWIAIRLTSVGRAPVAAQVGIGFDVLAEGLVGARHAARR